MIYHHLDLFLLKNILDSKTKISTWRLARLYDWQDKIKNKDDYYWRNKCSIIIQRLKKMEQDGLLVIFENKTKREYSVVGENVLMKKLKMPDGKIKNCLWIKEINSDWQIFAV